MTNEKFSPEELEVSPFDAVEFLDSEEAIAAYIEAAIEENDPAVLMSALNDVIRARGIAEIASKAGLGRESLYKTLRPGSEPRLATVMRLLGALNLRLSAIPAGNHAHVAMQVPAPFNKQAATPKRAAAATTAAAKESAPTKTATPKRTAKTATSRHGSRS